MIIVWFRKDLRLHDNPALYFAAKTGRPILPLYIWHPEGEDEWEFGAATRAWLQHSLTMLKVELKKLGLSLQIAKGDPLEVMQNLTRGSPSQLVYNRRYEPYAIREEKRIKDALINKGWQIDSFNGSLLIEPWEIKTDQGRPYQVFTPFWKKFSSMGDPLKPLPIPKEPIPIVTEKLLEIDDLHLAPKIHWDKKFYQSIQPGERHAMQHFEKFLNPAGIGEYSENRDFPGVIGTSQTSTHLHFGELSPRWMWHQIKQHVEKGVITSLQAASFLRQLVWREFAYHLLYHFPNTPMQPLRKEFEHFPWVYDKTKLDLWKSGMTGFPIVDAGMRQLWQTGWMHNRVRMIVASFLVKDLLIHWLEGAKWFWDTLTDADLANNTFGWQWTAGCGADAAPYFRIFNPITQGEKFDPDGSYVKKYVPELKGVSSKWVHRPFEAPPLELMQAGVTLGKNYPLPIVDHGHARVLALKALEQLRMGL